MRWGEQRVGEVGLTKISAPCKFTLSALGIVVKILLVSPPQVSPTNLTSPTKTISF
jgi:hypothetical protein